MKKLNSILFYFLVGMTLLALPSNQKLYAEPVDNLRHTLISSDTLTLQWQNQGGKSYVVVLSSVPGFSTVISSKTSGKNQHTTSFYELQPNTSYTTFVKVSVDPDSNYVALSTYTYPVSPGLTEFQIFTTSASFNLHSGLNNLLGISGSATSLTLDISTGNSEDFNISLSSSGKAIATNTTLVLSELIPNTNYAFQARATGFTNFSSSATTVITSTTTLAQPPTLTGFKVFSTSISIILGNNSNPIGTTLMVSTGSDGNYNVNHSLISSVSGENTTLTISDLSPQTAYSFQAAVLGSAENASTQTISVTDSTTTYAAVPGTNFFNNVYSTSFTVSWGTNGNPLIPPTTYELYISTANDFSSFLTHLTTSTQNTFIGLIPNTAYFFKTAAFSKNGELSGFNPEISTITSPSNLTPAGPGNFKVTAIGISSITFSWSDNSENEEQFRILNSTNGFYATLPANTTSFSLTGLSPNQFIQARISAFNSMGSSTNTVAISSHTLAAPPDNLILINVRRKKITLSWNSNSNPSTVIYEISQSKDNFSSQISTPISFSLLSSTSSASVSNLTPGGTYYFRVRAQNNDGTATSFSNIISTQTLLTETIITSNESDDSGDISLTADPGITITNNTLADGRTEQIFVATQSARVSYSNGIQLQLPMGSKTTIIASKNSLQITSTQTIPMEHDGINMDLPSGSHIFQISLNSFTLDLDPSIPQITKATLSTERTKTLLIGLELPQGKLKTSIPPNIMKENVEMEIKALDQFPPITSFASPLFGQSLLKAPSTLKALGIGLELNTNKNIQPSQPIEITFQYRSQDITGTDPETLVITRYEDSVQRWLTIPSVINHSSQTVTGTAKHLSKFQLMALAPSTDIDHPQVYPNPLRLHKGQTEMTFTNLTAHSTIKIYTYAGELVRELKTDSTGTIRWDAKNSYGEKVGSDIYIVLIEGIGNARKKMKIAVEK
ncbi:MAG: hypothetical protein A3I11_01535 [Elusimicrobia bacterium RIFCSPLOWO2_02_FULL_39_32]|nr:MAG: hypothetical protein A3B80_06020 [Elusimicrobia bacterium RIFCSPHIGHO2_02_FULL_39_36]OGR92359.1 MAG: hypothetical protein A3I11_01535 [Elusimicrobia bacterium RIFCSPLOWO2_02_FULL_39_32]OGR98902.1 MAG: hypothetical protein A3G85_03840 [Elusimicrobia bacterium RIFCSPLOWO2_12_FULL_39_28]